MTLNTRDLPGDRMAASITVANEITQALGAMGILPHFRPSHDAVTGLPADLVSAAAASDIGTSKTLAAALAAALESHTQDLDAHATSDGTLIAAWASKPALPANLTEVQNVLNEVKADFNTHIANATPHRALGGAGRAAQPAAIATADATDQTSANTLANALKAALNGHGRAGAQTIVIVAS